MVRKKKLNKRKLFLSIFIVFDILLIAVWARYVLIQNRDFYTKTLEFYFTSDKLTEDCPLYRIENWSGVDEYTIVINVNSNKNNILTANYEIDYEIEFTCSDSVLCELSKESGAIPLTTDSDTFTLEVSPNTQFNIGEIVYITITATAIAPYEKVISADFQLVVGQEKITYEIVDSVKSPYLELNITNTRTYYTVVETYGPLTEGEKITREAYLELSDLEKEKCYSGIITLQFAPEYVPLDMTNANYINATNIGKTSIDGYQYINSITFNIDAMTGTRVRFYKTDIMRDYTYPNSSGTSIITVISL